MLTPTTRSRKDLRHGTPPGPRAGRSSASRQIRARNAHGPTPAERAAWAELSGRKLGLGFRRQALVANYIVNFLAPARRPSFELGWPAQKRRMLVGLPARAGYRVLRLSAALVIGNPLLAV